MSEKHRQTSTQLLSVSLTLVGTWPRGGFDDGELKLRDFGSNLLLSKSFVFVLLPACFTHRQPRDSSVNMNVFIHFRGCSRVSF